MFPRIYKSLGASIQALTDQEIQDGVETKYRFDTKEGAHIQLAHVRLLPSTTA